MKKTILLLTLIPVHFLAMDQADQKQEITYGWQSVAKINERGTREYPNFTVPMDLNATLADFKRVIAEQRGNENFDLDMYFDTVEKEPSFAVMRKIASHIPGSNVFCAKRCVNFVQITCPETITLKTLIDAGPQLAGFVEDHVIFEAVPK